MGRGEVGRGEGGRGEVAKRGGGKRMDGTRALDGKMKAKWEEDGCEEGGRVGRVVGGREVANEDCHLEGGSIRQRQRTAPLW